MTTCFRHFTFGLLLLACTVGISSCSTEDSGQTLIVHFDDAFVPKQVGLAQDDQSKPATSTNPKKAVFTVIAAVTYKGKKSLEYIWAIDSSKIHVNSVIAPDTTTPNKATITLTYNAPLSQTVFDGPMPIKLLVKEQNGESQIQGSDTISVNVYINGGTNG